MIYHTTLSKHMSFSLPDTLMRGGDMQNMPPLRKRAWEYTQPTVIAHGMAGGTTMVNISHARITISNKVACRNGTLK